MPSPFPGMDPFLEDPAGWPDVNASLIFTILELIAPQLDPEYVIRIEERVYITDEFRDRAYPLLVPDILVAASPRRSGSATGTTAVTIDPALNFEEVAETEIHDRFLVIRDKKDRRVVTAIELLSPANKVTGSFGRELMDSKRDQFVQSGANWMEIDFLRAGTRTARWAEQSDYCITLKRAERSGLFAWLISLRDPLPRVAVPLDIGKEDMSLDLQRALDQTYDRSGYRRSVDYDESIPPPRLSVEDESWVRERIAAWRQQ